MVLIKWIVENVYWVRDYLWGTATPSILDFCGETYWPFTFLCESSLNKHFLNLKFRIQIKVLSLRNNFQWRNKILKKNLSDDMKQTESLGEVAQLTLDSTMPSAEKTPVTLLLRQPILNPELSEVLLFHPGFLCPSWIRKTFRYALYLGKWIQRSELIWNDSGRNDKSNCINLNVKDTRRKQNK